jgi:hypothetical protein
MTYGVNDIFFVERNAQKPERGWVRAYIPPIARCAMDGAPVRWWLMEGEQTTAKANAGFFAALRMTSSF